MSKTTNKALRGIQELQLDLLSQSSFDHLSFAVIDFKNKDTHSWSLEKNRVVRKNKIFDLASLTKPLLLSSYYLANKKIFNNSMLALLEHRIDIPAYGVLSRKSWKDIIKAYSLDQLSENQTRYSDYSSLRLMIEIGQDELYSFYKQELKDKHKLFFWKELDLNASDYAATGFRHNYIIQGQVHDPNAYNINEFCSHAGLFSDVDSLSHYLLNLDENHGLLESQKSRSIHRRKRPYFEGWDGVQNSETTLAGRTNSSHLHKNTFGFLGFTGTSIWIDPELQVGWVLLTNATQNYWHDRAVLNEIRRKSGQLVWPLFR